MIANVRDVTKKKTVGDVGITVCRAPSSGVTFTKFEVKPKVVKEEAPTVVKEEAQSSASNSIDADGLKDDKKQSKPSLFGKWKTVLSLL